MSAKSVFLGMQPLWMIFRGSVPNVEYVSGAIIPHC